MNSSVYFGVGNPVGIANTSTNRNEINGVRPHRPLLEAIESACEFAARPAPFLALAAMALLTIPAYAQPAETCLTKTLWGDDIDPPMCFAPEGISESRGSCEFVTAPADLPRSVQCASSRPHIPAPAPSGDPK